MRKLLNALRYFYSEFEKGKEQEMLLSRIQMEHSWGIERPFLSIDGPERISMGPHPSIGKNAWVSCYEKYGDQEFKPRMTIGADVRIGNYACITAIDEIVIGDRGGQFVSERTLGDIEHLGAHAFRALLVSIEVATDIQLPIFLVVRRHDGF